MGGCIKFRRRLWGRNRGFKGKVSNLLRVVKVENEWNFREREFLEWEED